MELKYLPPPAGGVPLPSRHPGLSENRSTQRHRDGILIGPRAATRRNTWGLRIRKNTTNWGPTPPGLNFQSSKTENSVAGEKGTGLVLCKPYTTTATAQYSTLCITIQRQGNAGSAMVSAWRVTDQHSIRGRMDLLQVRKARGSLANMLVVDHLGYKSSWDNPSKLRGDVCT